MKGVVFSEFLQFVEEAHGAEMVDDIIEGSGVAGAYTSVGTYAHEELAALLAELARRTGIAVPSLLESFGIHLAGSFARSHPAMFDRSPTLFDFLASVHNHIHVEVRKLYPDAELPSFQVVSRGERRLVLEYRSPRRLQDLARGLIIGVARRYRTAIELRTQLAPGNEGGTRFAVNLR